MLMQFGGGADLRVPVLGKRLMPRKRSTGVNGGPAVDQSPGRPAILCDADAVTLDGSAAEGRFRALLDVLPAAIYVTDADGRITYYNQAAADLAGREPRLGTDEWCVSWRLYSMDGRPMRHDECPMAVALKENRAVRGAEAIFGYTAEEMIGQPITRLFPADRLLEEDVILERIRRGERVDHFETVRRCKDGREIDISVTISPVRDVSGRIVGASKIARDITDKKRAEAALRDLNDRLEQRVAERTRELAEANNRLLTETAERERTEAELLQAQKMDAVGQLVSGLAHDFNNLLAAILGNLELLEMRLSDPH